MEEPGLNYSEEKLYYRQLDKASPKVTKNPRSAAFLATVVNIKRKKRVLTLTPSFRYTKICFIHLLANQFS